MSYPIGGVRAENRDQGRDGVARFTLRGSGLLVERRKRGHGSLCPQAEHFLSGWQLCPD